MPMLFRQVCVKSARLSRAVRFLSTRKPVLTTDTINPLMRQVEYAVRGEIPARAHFHEHELEEGIKRPFDSIVWTSIGNPQQQPNLAQKPLTFWRQVAALTEYPELLELPGDVLDKTFPADTRERAKDLLRDLGSTGSYSKSQGSDLVRQHVADFLEERDGHPENIHNIYLTSGASNGVMILFQTLFRGGQDGVLIPIPQYPLYSALLPLLDVEPLHYYLQSEQHWDMSPQDIKNQIEQARSEGIEPRAIVVINPGNPTGACLTIEEIQDVLRIAYDERLVIFADEVYQNNIFQNDRPFVSFRKALLDLGWSENPKERAISQSVELFSLHSISKGNSGECGRRGGFFTMTNIDPGVEQQINKLASIQLCPPTQGQIGVDMLVKPPRPGQPSYELWEKETREIHVTLQHRSETIAKRLRDLPGMSIEPAMGALYVFPRVTLPKKAVDAAERAGKRADVFYCLEMLDRSGVCVVPGSGFGLPLEKRPDGSCHIFFRTTILSKNTDDMVERLAKFHSDFFAEYQ